MSLPKSLMRSVHLTILIYLIAASPVMAQPLGTWTGAIALPNLNLNISVHLTQADDALSATIDIPQQGAIGLPLQNVRYAADTLSFELQAGPGLATFASTFATSDRLEGTFQQAGISAPFFIERTPENTQASSEASEAMGTAVELVIASGTLHGTLIVPDGVAQPPVALLIAGSGPTDRDGNTRAGSMQLINNSLRLLAEDLAAQGIATLRYDKRGVAASLGAATNEADLRFSDYVDDAVAWLNQLNADPQFGNLFVIGHSEGALIGTLAAQQVDVAGVITMAGAGRTAPAVLDEQLSNQLTGDLLDQARTIMSELSEGRTVDETPPALATLFRSSVQPYIISWFRHDPAQALAELSMPVLIVQGTTDVQVPTSDAHLLATTTPDAELVIIDGMNHVLKAASGDRVAQLPVYTNPDLPLHKNLIAPLARFIQAQ